VGEKSGVLLNKGGFVGEERQSFGRFCNG